MRKTMSNFIYQAIFQISKLLLPIITIPIISNALGPVGIGQYNYTNSIAQYFVLFAGLGIGVYGNREIATHRDSKDSLSKTFWELFFLSLIFSVISLILYILIVSFFENRFLFYCQSLIIVAALFDISWFFMGIEDFKKTSISGLIAQVIAFILILFMVKSPTDTYKYILIQGSYLLVSQLIMWIFLLKEIHWVKTSFKNLYKHFFLAIQYFIPKIAIILYTNLNKTLLEWMDSTISVGYYSNSLVINSVIITLITTLDLVLLPKMSNLVSKGNKKAVLKIMEQTIHLQLFFSIAAMFGVSTISYHLIPWFFGQEFLFIRKTIPLLAPIIVIMPLGMAISRQYLLPFNKVKVYNLAVINGAIISVVSNLVLIPFIGIYGAILATILAELFVTITRTYSFIKETNFSFNKRFILSYFFSGFIMFVIVSCVTFKMTNSIKTTLIQICLGVAIYLISTYVLGTNPIIHFLKKRRNSKKV